MNRQLNLLSSKRNNLSYVSRATRTRTLIQLGGLLVKSGIAEKLGIIIGADLQREEEQKKKAYVLLGMFVNQLSIPKKIEEIEEFEELGRQFLFENKNTDSDQTIKDVSKNLVTA